MNYNLDKTFTLANTFSAIMSVQPVKGGAEELFSFVSEVGEVNRGLIYHPLHVGQSLLERYSPLKDKIEEVCDKRLELVASDKCKGINALLSMYTGSEKGQESLFDKLVKEKKRCVVVLPSKYERLSSFFPACVELKLYEIPSSGINVALSLIKSDDYDFIVFVDSEYAESAILTGPESKLSIQIVKRELDDFILLANAAEVFWRDKRTIVGFCPERGVHKSLLWGRSGTKRVEDLNVLHYFAIQEKTLIER